MPRVFHVAKRSFFCGEVGLGGRGGEAKKGGPDRRANLRPHHAENQKPKKQRARSALTRTRTSRTYFA